MTPSGRNISATLLLVAIVAVCIAFTPAESALVGGYPCKNHLSGNYKGVCWSMINDDGCRRTCLNERSDNISGMCLSFQCWCYRCTPDETASTASAPIRQ
ncbi:hypothetical protein HU200_042977 [Digitaria exilis]|uniref:Knottin scorpion toxin-like domain-containing protein n=1 Tax=Digitaria exilis TaxID=1010633 RepID=A0A835BF45_9POAL|nr:hypothetical protein HU200_042977 [Digitaria exilis]